MKYFNTSVRGFAAFLHDTLENSNLHVVNNFIVANGIYHVPFCIHRLSHKGTIKLDIEKICQRMYCLSSLINYSFAGILTYKTSTPHSY